MEFDDRGIRFTDYPFPGASVYPNGVVPVSKIRSTDTTMTFPPELRTQAGETLFIPAQFRGELDTYAATRRVPTKRRDDIWGALLEPYLDTEFTENERARTDAVLTRAGIADGEAQAIRQQVEPVMTAFELVHWDWFHLGLCDLLDALVQGFGTATPRSQPELEHFYRWAMEIADRARET